MNIIDRIEDIVNKQLINKNVDVKRDIIFVISKDVDESLCKYLNKNIIGEVKIKTSHRIKLEIFTYTINIVVNKQKNNNSIICTANGYY